MKARGIKQLSAIALCWCMVQAAHAAGEDTFTYGLLYQQEDDLARTTREQLAAALKALHKTMK